MPGEANCSVHREDDLDLDRGFLSINRSIVLVKGRPVISEPKTRGSRRRVALDAETISALRRHLRGQAEERLRLGEAYSDSGLLFSKEDGSALRPDTIGKMVPALAAAAGLPRLTFHGLRHTHATAGLAAGIHPKIVSERLGHSSIGITLDTY